MKKVAGGLRLDLAAFRELEAFAQLGTELDKATQNQLDRGYRMVELLKQPQYQPMSAIDQVMSIFAGTEGYLDDVDRRAVPQWETAFLTFINERKPAVRAELEREKKMTTKIEADLSAAITEFKGKWIAVSLRRAKCAEWHVKRCDRSSSCNDRRADGSYAAIAMRLDVHAARTSTTTTDIATSNDNEQHQWPKPARSSNAARRSRTSARSRGRWS